MKTDTMSSSAGDDDADVAQRFRRSGLVRTMDLSPSVTIAGFSTGDTTISIGALFAGISEVCLMLSFTSEGRFSSAYGSASPLSRKSANSDIFPRMRLASKTSGGMRESPVGVL